MVWVYPNWCMVCLSQTNGFAKPALNLFPTAKYLKQEGVSKPVVQIFLKI